MEAGREPRASRIWSAHLKERSCRYLGGRRGRGGRVYKTMSSVLGLWAWDSVGHAQRHLVSQLTGWVVGYLWALWVQRHLAFYPEGGGSPGGFEAVVSIKRKGGVKNGFDLSLLKEVDLN